MTGADPQDHPTGDVIAAIRTAAGAPRAATEHHPPDPAHHDGPASAEQDTETAAEDWELVQRVQAGETAAFGLIYDRYVDTVFRFVYFRVGNRLLAEDITSDTFLRALRRIGGFTWQGQDLGAWLVTIARDLVADHLGSGHHRLETTGEKPVFDNRDRPISNDSD